MLEQYQFKKAVPVWEKDKENEINYSLVFSGKIARSEKAFLKITGHGNYNIYVNGEHIAMGPARTAHTFFRVDEIPLGAHLTDAINTLKIIVAGYNCGGFYITRQPSFLCAEVEDGNGNILLCTSADKSPDSFSCESDTERERKCQRYGSARTFCEVYNIGGERIPEAAELSVSSAPVTFIKRHAPYPEYAKIYPLKASGYSTFIRDTACAIPYDGFDWGIKNGTMIGYIPEDIPRSAFKEAKQFKITGAKSHIPENCTDLILQPGECISLVMPYNVTGFLSFRISAKADTDIYVTYDELCNENALPSFSRLSLLNTLLWHFEKDGEYTVETREMYTLRHLCIWVLGSSAEISDLHISEFAYPESGINAQIPAALKNDQELYGIYKAAVTTFRSNAADIYMDCPSRERAGWLCDSYFTSKSEYILTGRSLVERDFLENFMLPDHFERLPDGMLAMCYPAEPDGLYIINWAMWFILEMGEYLDRTGDREFIEFSKAKIYKLLNLISKYENSDGLIEKLDSWVFIEWSRSNDLVQDISYPSNMVYSMALEAAGKMFGDRMLAEKSLKLKKTIREKSLMSSGFFCDNAVYGEDGTATLSGECTETCQYYAFVSGVADTERDGILWKKLTDSFGPKRVDEHNNITEGAAYPEISPSNTFIGIMLRLLVMDRFGEKEKLLEDIRNYFGFMAEKTGTIWESQTDDCSCCHGFGSFVAYLLLRNM